MKNQHTKQQATSTELAKKGNGRKSLPKAGLRLGIITAAFIAICLTMFSCASTSRPSTSAEISEQMEFQEKWNTEQKEAEQKWDSTLKAEQNAESIGK